MHLQLVEEISASDQDFKNVTIKNVHDVLICLLCVHVWKWSIILSTHFICLHGA